MSRRLGRAARPSPYDGMLPGTVRAVDIARASGQPPPTDEQVAVIEAPPGPVLVVAGAGTGKTEPLAASNCHRG